MARLVTVLLQRTDDSVPWGFRIQGGADYNQSLSVQRVTPGTLASQHLSPGDVLIMIEGQDARLMCHFDACELIKMAGNTVELIVRKSNSRHLCDENISQQEKLEQTVVEERFRQEEEKLKKKALKEAKSPPFSSNSSLTSFSPRSTPAGQMSPQATTMSPVPNKEMFEETCRPCSSVIESQGLQMSQKNAQVTSSFQSQDVIEQSMMRESSSSTSFSTQLKTSISQPKSNLPMSPPRNPSVTEPSLISSAVQMFQNASSFPFSPPPMNESPNFFPLSPPLFGSLPKPFSMSPQVRRQTPESANLDPAVKANNEAKLYQERTSTSTDIHSEVSGDFQSKSRTVTTVAQQIQKTFKPQVSAREQTNSTKNTTSPQRVMSPLATSNVLRRTSCSPQRTIPPLPKTHFPDNASSFQDEAFAESQKIQSFHEHERSRSSIQFKDNSRRPFQKNETPPRSAQPFSPKQFPLLQELAGRKPISSPPVHPAISSNFSTPVRMFSPQSFQNNQQVSQTSQEINPHLLSKKLHDLQQEEDVGSSSSHGSSQPHTDVQPNMERRSHSIEREPMTIEEYKQRQLQKLIEEKVRLEEIMMIAKRRQSITESNETMTQRKEAKPQSKVDDVQLPPEEPKIESKMPEKLQKIPQSNSKGAIPKYETNMAPTVAIESKSTAIREKEEESKLRKENQLRDEKIRRMQERRYEEKLKKNVMRSARDKSCPPDSKAEVDSCNESKTSKSRKSRDRTKSRAKERITRDKSCPVNINERTAKSSQNDQVNVDISKSKTAQASSFISSKLKYVSLGAYNRRASIKETDAKTDIKTPLSSYKLPQEIKVVKLSSESVSINPPPGERNHGENTNTNTEERLTLFESLKQDQRRIEEEFQKRDAAKKNKFIDSFKKDIDHRQKVIPKEPELSLQHEAQKWHAQLQMQEAINKQEELKIQEKYQVQVNKPENIRSCLNSTPVKTEGSSFENSQGNNVSGGRKLENKSQNIRNNNMKPDFQMQQEIKQQEAHWLEMQAEIHRKEELQWQELQKTLLGKESMKKKRSSYSPTSSKGQENSEQDTKHAEKIAKENDIKIQLQKKFEKIRREEEEKQKELKVREDFLKMEEKKLIEKIINEEEKKLLEQKRILEAKQRKSRSELALRKSPTQSRTQGNLPNNEASTAFEGERAVAAMRHSAVVPMKHEVKHEEPQLLSKDQEEEKIEDLRKQEEERMKEEVRMYEDYQRHLETKRNAQSYDSDDYASEIDTGEDDEDNKPRGLYLEEKFDELKATSEEELFEAQEKSIRNLDRQLRKQRQREMRKNYERRHQNSSTPSRQHKKSSSIEASNEKIYSSTGDLQSKPSRTLPVTKFSPDPMEFGFRPIETPHSIISRSTGNLMSGGGPSASSIAHVAGAEAGVAAIKKPVTRKFVYQDDFSKQDSRFRISSSLEDLQQDPKPVSRFAKRNWVYNRRSFPRKFFTHDDE